MKLLPILLLLAASPALSANLILDPAQSRVGFRYLQMGSDAEGEFRHFSADIQFDSASPEAGRVIVSIDPASIDTGLPDANTEAAQPGFFDTRKFREARFESGSIKPLGGGRYRVTGKLTIKGVSRALNTIAVIRPEGTAQRLTGAFALNRLDYGIGTGMWSDTSVLANEVRVAYSLLLLSTATK
jgi:polyisoprenoid-binding protein YceI